MTVLIGHLPLMADGVGIKLQLSDGTTQFLLLEDEPSARFKGDTLVVTSKQQEVCVSLADGFIVGVTYVDEVTRIAEAEKKPHSVFRMSESGFEASGLTPKSYVYVYDLRGVVVGKSVVHDDGTISIPLASKGIYVVKTSVSSFKIKK